MTLHSAAIDLTFAVKNGPADMWRALGPRVPIRAAGRFVTSPLWLTATVCMSLALALFAYRRWRRGRAAPGAVIATVVLGLIVALEALTRSPVAGSLAFALMAGILIAVLWRPGVRHARQPPGHTAEVIDLARWRESRKPRRRAGSQ